MNKTNFLGHASWLEIKSLARWLDRITIISRAEDKENDNEEVVEAPLTPLPDDKY